MYCTTVQINKILITPGARVLVVGTLTVEEGQSLEDPEFLGLPQLFLQHQYIPLLDTSSTLTFLDAKNIHRYMHDRIQTVCSIWKSHWLSRVID